MYAASMTAVWYVEDGVPVYDRVDALFGNGGSDPASIGTINVLTGYIPPEDGLKSGAVIEVQSSTARGTGWTANIEAVSGAMRFYPPVRSGGPVGGRASLGVSVASERSDRFLDPCIPTTFTTREGCCRLRPISAPRFRAISSRSNVTAGRSRYDAPHGERREAGR